MGGERRDGREGGEGGRGEIRERMRYGRGEQKEETTGT